MAVKELIQTVTVSSGGAASIDFTNIPQIYTDLQLVISGRNGIADIWDAVYLRLNGLNTNFTGRRIYGYNQGGGETVGSSSLTDGRIGEVVSANATASTFSVIDAHIGNYSSSTTYKAISSDSVTEQNSANTERTITATLWSNYSPVTSISLIAGTGSFVQYSTASLYGIRSGSDGVTTPSTTGGVIATSGGYTYHTFLNSGTFNATRPLNIEALVVAGGGGGAGGAGGGGGGAGGYQLITGKSVTKGAYSVIIGAGGTNGTGGVTAGNGGDSSFLDIVSFGGAGGGQTDGTGRNGGSGSGNGSFHAGAGLGVAGQGNNGGDSGSASPYNAGGGGGAGAAGSGMNGGIGSNSASVWATATSTGVGGYYAGGGGGGTYYSSNSYGSGGAGGGGNGTNTNGSATSGTANTGGGGGGSGNQYNGGQGSTGGSGIVIIRYLTPA